MVTVLVICCLPYIVNEAKTGTIVNTSRVFRGATIISKKGTIMMQTCPISARRVDANMMRVISAQVALFLTLFLVTGELFFVAIIVYDYVVRALRKTFLSPFFYAGTCFLKTFGIEAKLSDESPKRFALFLGLISSTVIALSLLFNVSIVGQVIAVILIICALMESLFDFCIGCKLYYAIQIFKGFFTHARNLK